MTGWAACDGTIAAFAECLKGGVTPVVEVQDSGSADLSSALQYLRVQEKARELLGLALPTSSPAPTEGFTAASVQTCAPTLNAQQIVTVATDGSALNNPGPGGWAYVVRQGAYAQERSGSTPATTNNRMELVAAIMALQDLPEGCTIELLTDAKYIAEGMTSWLRNWKQRDWRAANGKPVLNRELWEQLEAAASRHKEVCWRWVEGHAGHPDNERANLLAQEMARKEVAA